MHTILEETLRDVSLAINTRASLKPKGFLRHQAMERPMLLDKDEGAEGVKGAIVRLQNRRRR